MRYAQYINNAETYFLYANGQMIVDHQIIVENAAKTRMDGRRPSNNFLMQKQLI
jgi:hypothetical protein